VQKTGDRIKIFQPLAAYTNYCFLGEDIKAGELVLTAGTMINPAAITLLAGQGLSKVLVYRLPKIAIISTGDELLDINEQLYTHEQLTGGKIFNSNSYTLAAEVQRIGAVPVRAGIVGDRAGLIADRITQTLPHADLVITTGGVSVGDYDTVKDSLTAIGAKILFHRVNMRPGTPALGAVKDGKIIIGLSGNPGAAFVSYHLIAKPAIFKLMGLAQWQVPGSTAILQEDYPKTSKQRRLLRAQVFVDEGMQKVTLTGKQNPGIIKSMLDCNALIDIPGNSPGLTSGSRTRVILLH
jgi:molybdopterin molybdotransferase